MEWRISAVLQLRGTATPQSSAEGILPDFAGHPNHLQQSPTIPTIPNHRQPSPTCPTPPVGPQGRLAQPFNGAVESRNGAGLVSLEFAAGLVWQRQRELSFGD